MDGEGGQVIPGTGGVSAGEGRGGRERGGWTGKGAR